MIAGSYSSLLKNIGLFIFVLCLCVACMYAYALCVSLVSTEGVLSPQTGVMDGYELPHGC